MDDSTAVLAQAIGSRVRAERKVRGWTLDQLAAAAGVSRRMLVSVEQASANPSVGTLLKLSDALGVGLPALVEPAVPDAVRVTRAGDGAVLWSGSTGGRGVLVAGTEPPDVLELWDWILEPGERHESESHTAGTQELLQVLEGEIVLKVGGQSVSLAAGDAVGFGGDAPHVYANPHARAARFSLAVYQPNVGLRK